MTLNARPKPSFDQGEDRTAATTTTPSYILSCPYCQWSTLDISLTFDKPTNLTEQILNHNRPSSASPAPSKLQHSEAMQLTSTPTSSSSITETRFQRLKSHLSSQLSLSASSSSVNPLLTPSGGSLSYDSPSSLARIMALYTSSSTPYGKKSTTKNPVMREASDAKEGLLVFDPEADHAAVRKLKASGWEGTVSGEQRREQQVLLSSATSREQQARLFHDDLRPIPMLMRTKRAKRCRECRHILVKPEAKITSTRYRIRLIAANTLPSVTWKPLSSRSSSLTSSTTLRENKNQQQGKDDGQVEGSRLPADGTPQQFLLTLKNPLFEKVRVSLATPTTLPLAAGNQRDGGDGASQPAVKFTHRITLLCPEFDIGANTDAWDEALSKDPIVASSARDKRSSVLTGAGGAGGGSSAGASSGGGGTSSKTAAEAGKIWEKGRNWTTVVVEIVSSSSSSSTTTSSTTSKNIGSTSGGQQQHQHQHQQGNEENGSHQSDSESEDEDEDEYILEIPIHVRMEWEAEASTATGGGGGGKVPAGSDGGGGATATAATSATSGREKRELEYWMVLGVGRLVALGI